MRTRSRPSSGRPSARPEQLRAEKKLRDARCKTYTWQEWSWPLKSRSFLRVLKITKEIGGADGGKIYFLHGIDIAMFIMGQERRLVDPPSQVVAGVRTVTTNMNGRDTLPRCRAHSLFYYLKTSSA